jgi:hypothetical protein
LPPLGLAACSLFAPSLPPRCSAWHFEAFSHSAAASFARRRSVTELEAVRKMLERGMVILLELNWLDTLNLKFFFFEIGAQ